MKENTLKAILRLFAISCNLLKEKKSDLSFKMIKKYLLQYTDYNNSEKYFKIFDYYLNDFRKRIENKRKDRDPLFNVKTVIICEQIKKNLLLVDRIKLLITIIQFFTAEKELTTIEEDFIKTIGISFNIDLDTLFEIKMFIFKRLDELNKKQNLLILKSKSDNEGFDLLDNKIKYLKGEIYFLLIPEIKSILFFYNGPNEYIYIGNKFVLPSFVYILDKGDVLYNPVFGNIHYGDILKEFFKRKEVYKIDLTAINIEYKFSDKITGIYQFSFHAESGQLVGIMGSSGSGKTTLINLLNGNLKPSKGKVLINGYDLHENDILKSLMGYIPQEDLLIEELTVFENLYYSSKLCFGNLSDEEIIKKIDGLLYELDLYEIRNLKVGTIFNKFISGGQRKRLNIALELIRQPLILFVDEPTSGLSSNDSLMVMELLKELTYKGMLIIANIHQPSSEIFKLFDKLMVIDRGGRVIYYGNPLEAITYFKNSYNLLDPEKTECITCGNVNPELILQIVEAKEINEQGFYTDKRIVSPEEWYNAYKKNIEPVIKKIKIEKKPIPQKLYNPPGLYRQFIIFLKRNIVTKMSELNYVLLNLLETPLLALILSVFIKYQIQTTNGNIKYVFSKNINLPIYLFMSVIVALFIGMMISAEEIIRDRKILKRESFLNLSSFSYYNSKVFYLIMASAYQAMAFVIVGNAILQIKGMYFAYWIILFSTAVFANILGLIISDNMKSVVSIYISIPLLLIPQILFGGSMVRFDKLNRYITSQKYVPLIGDIMVSRWAYEALAVNQFVKNRYEKNFYFIEKQESDAYYYMNILIPELESKLDLCYIALKEKQLNKFRNNFLTIKNEIKKLTCYYNEIPYFEIIDKIDEKNFIDYHSQLIAYTAKIRNFFSKKLDLILKTKDETIRKLEIIYGGKEKLQNLKNDYYNEELANILMAKYDQIFIYEYKNEIIRKMEPIFNYPDSNIGRAHMFAPVKKIFNVYIDTFCFNLLMLWIINLLFYLILTQKVIQKISEFIGKYIMNLRYFIQYKI